VLAVFALLTLTFFLLGIGDMSGTETITKVGGYVGVLTALAAWYASFAGVTAFTFKRPLVPTGVR
jgi:succinate-acetate transporter protein